MFFNFLKNKSSLEHDLDFEVSGTNWYSKIERLKYVHIHQTYHPDPIFSHTKKYVIYNTPSDH
jgi:hypothetical protein